MNRTFNLKSIDLALLFSHYRFSTTVLQQPFFNKKESPEMKITVDVDITPEELRSFLGLPNVERLQEQMLSNAQEYLKEAGQTEYADLLSGAMQPLFAYQNWVKNMLTGTTSKSKTQNENGKSGNE